MTFIVYNFHWWKWFFKVAMVPLVSIQTTITGYFDQNHKLWKKSYETTDAGTSSKKTLKSRLYTAVLPFSTGGMWVWWVGALCREEQVSPAICFLLKCRKISASNLESVGDKAVSMTNQNYSDYSSKSNSWGQKYSHSPISFLPGGQLVQLGLQQYLG